MPISESDGHDYAGRIMDGPSWWRIVLRHPIREARWWLRYGR